MSDDKYWKDLNKYWNTWRTDVTTAPSVDIYVNALEVECGTDWCFNKCCCCCCTLRLKGQCWSRSRHWSNETPPSCVTHFSVAERCRGNHSVRQTSTLNSRWHRQKSNRPGAAAANDGLQRDAGGHMRRQLWLTHTNFDSFVAAELNCFLCFNCNSFYCIVP